MGVVVVGSRNLGNGYVRRNDKSDDVPRKEVQGAEESGWVKYRSVLEIEREADV